MAAETHHLLNQVLGLGTCLDTWSGGAHWVMKYLQMHPEHPRARVYYM